jgi:hypothetical protein
LATPFRRASAYLGNEPCRFGPIRRESCELEP